MTINTVKGMNDILPQEISLWHYLEQIFFTILKQYNYTEIRLNLVEHAELFHRDLGQNSAILQKEMYYLQYRGEKQLVLRPEGTASCIRALSNNSMLKSSHRLWYYGPMFRHEQPQAGRKRSFYQLGIENINNTSLSQEIEIFLLTSRVFDSLHLLDKVHLHINYLGTFEEQNRYGQALKNYFSQYHLNDTHQKTLLMNPLRILDSKSSEIINLLNNAPNINEYIKRNNDFYTLLAYLKDSHIQIVDNPYLVRGLDYYNGTVFEWKIRDNIISHNTLCAGGRYDKLVNNGTAFGCAFGIDRLIFILKQLQISLPTVKLLKKILIIYESTQLIKALQLRESLLTIYLDQICLVEKKTMNNLKKLISLGKEYQALIIVYKLEYKIFLDKKEHISQSLGDVLSIMEKLFF
jgi:histidyl-tRNA synthetase